MHRFTGYFLGGDDPWDSASAVLGADLAIIWLDASAGSVPGVLAEAIVVSFASGLLLPTLLVWTIDDLHFAERGRVTGLWNASFFCGQFLCPIVISIVQGNGGLAALPVAIGLVGVASIVLGLGAGIVVRSTAQSIPEVNASEA